VGYQKCKRDAVCLPPFHPPSGSPAGHGPRAVAAALFQWQMISFSARLGTAAAAPRHPLGCRVLGRRASNGSCEPVGFWRTRNRRLLACRGKRGGGRRGVRDPPPPSLLIGKGGKSAGWEVAIPPPLPRLEFGHLPIQVWPSFSFPQRPVDTTKPLYSLGGGKCRTGKKGEETMGWGEWEERG